MTEVERILGLDEFRDVETIVANNVVASPAEQVAISTQLPYDMLCLGVMGLFPTGYNTSVSNPDDRHIWVAYESKNPSNSYVITRGTQLISLLSTYTQQLGSYPVGPAIWVNNQAMVRCRRVIPQGAVITSGAVGTAPIYSVFVYLTRVI